MVTVAWDLGPEIVGATILRLVAVDIGDRIALGIVVRTTGKAVHGIRDARLTIVSDAEGNSGGHVWLE